MTRYADLEVRVLGFNFLSYFDTTVTPPYIPISPNLTQGKRSKERRRSSVKEAELRVVAHITNVLGLIP